MVTEYEQLLSEMLKERKEKLEKLQVAKGKNQKKVDVLLSEINFVEGELERYPTRDDALQVQGAAKGRALGQPRDLSPRRGDNVVLKGFK